MLPPPTRAVIDQLFLRLPKGQHELVLFDLNRRAAAKDLVRSDPKAPSKETSPASGDLAFKTYVRELVSVPALHPTAVLTLVALLLGAGALLLRGRLRHPS